MEWPPFRHSSMVDMTDHLQAARFVMWNNAMFVKQYSQVIYLVLFYRTGGKMSCQSLTARQCITWPCVTWIDLILTNLIRTTFLSTSKCFQDTDQSMFKFFIANKKIGDKDGSCRPHFSSMLVEAGGLHWVDSLGHHDIISAVSVTKLALCPMYCIPPNFHRGANL